MTQHRDLYFRQLLAGRDFAKDDPIARQMVNFCYLIGDRATGEAVAIDPAYDIEGLFGVLEADDVRLAGVLATHYHADHIGGDLMGYPVQGVKDVLERVAVPVHVQRDEAPWVARSSGLSLSELKLHESGDVVEIGGLRIELVHTPGHTPGSQCFFVEGCLISGDTLFLEGCGRTDLPGGDPEEMYRSLTTRLARFADGTVLFPGHLYSPDPSATLGDTRARNYVFRLRSPEQWMTMFGS